MPKIATPLRALDVKRLHKPGMHAVGGVAGLVLHIRDTGARSWTLRTMIAGKRRNIGLGPYPEVSLARAREKAAELREKIRDGVDPLAERRDTRAALQAAEASRVTFAEAARRTHAARAAEFSNAKHRRDWLSSLERYAFDEIGHLNVDTIELPHIQAVLEPIWQERNETATRVRQRIETVLSWATVSGFRNGENPARWRGNLEAVLPKPSKIQKKRHYPALPVKEMPGFFAELQRREGMGARALEFIVLTATRSGEVRGATWDEIDFEARTWTVPAERMKARQEHVVPLSPAAISLLKRLPRLEGSPYVFPAVRGGMLSDMSISAVCRRMEVNAVPHGMRASFRTWAAEYTNVPREVCEQALAHTIENKVEAAYRRGDLLDKRRKLMNQWARFLKQ